MAFVDRIGVQDENLTPHHEFWKTHFSSFENGFRLWRYDHRKSNGSSRNEASCSMTLPKAIGNKPSDVRVFTFVLSVISVLMKRVSFRNDIVVLVPKMPAGDKPNSENIPVGISINEDEKLLTLLERVGDVLKNCYSFQEFPIEYFGSSKDLSNVLLFSHSIHSNVSGESDFSDGISGSGRELQLNVR
ncbi:MAG: hypothetical protein ACKO96_17165, partial [Flammeovirgaceae bacterium]